MKGPASCRALVWGWLEVIRLMLMHTIYSKMTMEKDKTAISFNHPQHHVPLAEESNIYTHTSPFTMRHVHCFV